MMTSSLGWLFQVSPSFRGFSAQSLALLVEASCKGTIFLLLAVAAARALRRASAATRHMIWTLALGALLVLPIASLTLPAWKVPMLLPSPTVATGEQRITSEDLAMATPSHQPNAHRAARRTIFEMAVSSPWVGWIVFLWAAGAMLWAARIAVGEVRVRRIARRAQLLETSQTNSCWENLRRLLCIGRTVELRTSTEISVPFTWGVFQPTVLLPAEAHQWSRKRLESVLAHELAHVQRFDCLTQVPAQVACALFWFHPLVWLASFEIRKERERACDDIVLSLGHPPTDYAEFLLMLSRRLRRLDGAWLTSVALAHSSQLEVRMQALLDPKLNHRPLAARRVLFAAALAVALLVPVAIIHATAQNAPGRISGTVDDPSGAVIPGANVTLINLDTQHSIVGHTGEDGAFEFLAIAAGRYRLEFAKRGFVRAKSPDLELKPSGDLHQNMTLPIGEVLQQVTVRGHKSSDNSPPPPSAPRRIRVGGLIEAAHLIRQAKPEYPASAEKQGIEGTVTLRAVIGTTVRFWRSRPSVALTLP